MKKKIICALLAFVMIIGVVGSLAACNDDPPVCTEHVDADSDKKCDNCGADIKTEGDGGEETGAHKCVDKNNDNKCDKCGKDMGNGGGGSTAWERPEVYWDSVTFIYQMTNHSAGGQFKPAGARYLAGEYDGEETEIDEKVAARNEAAADYARIPDNGITFAYYPDTAQYGWGKAVEIIQKDISSTDTEGLPDMYVNYVYDMVAASLQGCFANLYGTTRGQGTNHFPFNEFRKNFYKYDGSFDETRDGEGYMYEFMTTLTLSKNRMYLLASDYHIDLVRAFFVMPVNVKLLEQIGSNYTDITGDGVYNLDDLYQEVYNRTWTYNRLATMSKDVYSDDANTGRKDLADVIGLALCPQGGLTSSGILYSTNCTIIERVENKATQDYEYSYPTSNDKLVAVFDALNDLMKKPGIITVNGTNEEASLTGSTYPMSCIAIRFSQDKVLFGGVLLVGYLEQNEYQSMKDGSGFGIVPVPLYSDTTDDPYLTQIHNEGKIGAISFKTTKFEQCTAYLDSLSTNSAEILEDYYRYELQYGTLGEDVGTIKMMDYIREHVRSAFDKTWEDAMGMFYETSENRWHNILHSNSFAVADFRTEYNRLIKTKQDDLKKLVVFYDTLGD